MYRYFLIQMDWQGDDQRTVVRTDEEKCGPRKYHYDVCDWESAAELWSSVLFRGSYDYKEIDEDTAKEIITKHGGKF